MPGPLLNVHPLCSPGIYTTHLPLPIISAFLRRLRRFWKAHNIHSFANLPRFDCIVSLMSGLNLSHHPPITHSHFGSMHHHYGHKEVVPRDCWDTSTEGLPKALTCECSSGDRDFTDLHPTRLAPHLHCLISSI